MSSNNNTEATKSIDNMKDAVDQCQRENLAAEGFIYDAFNIQDIDESQVKQLLGHNKAETAECIKDAITR